MVHGTVFLLLIIICAVFYSGVYSGVEEKLDPPTEIVERAGPPPKKMDQQPSKKMGPKPPKKVATPPKEMDTPPPKKMDPQPPKMDPPPCPYEVRPAEFGRNKTPKVDYVSSNRTIIYEFKVPQNNQPWDVIWIHFTVLSNSSTHHGLLFSPVGVNLNAVHGGTDAFSVPYYVDDEKHYVDQLERWLCPAVKDYTVTIKRNGRNKKEHHDSNAFMLGELAKIVGALADPTVAMRAVMSTASVTPIAFNLRGSATTIDNFNIKPNDKSPTNLSASVSQPAPRLVKIPKDAKAVRITVISNSDLCGMLVIQTPICPFINNVNDAAHAFKRLTYTKRADVVIEREELDSFFLILLTLPSNEMCGGNDDKRKIEEKKTSAITVSTVSTGSGYLLPTVLSIAMFSLFYVAVAPVVIYSAFRKALGRADTEIPPINGGHDNEPILERSVSRSLSPQPQAAIIDSASSAVDPATGRLINISSNISMASSENGRVENRTLSLQLNDDQRMQGIEEERRESLDGAEIDLRNGDREALSRGAASGITSDDECILNDFDKMSQVGTNRQKLERDTRAYAWIQLILSGFLVLVVVQQVAWAFPQFASTGNLDICYYNGRCAAPLGQVNSFNQIYSNIGYVLLGFLQLLILRKRYKKHMSQLVEKGPHIVHSFGLPTHYGLMSAICIGTIGQGFLSMVYHVCPNGSTIQFELLNIYLAAILVILKLYGTRHEPTKPHIAYMVGLFFWTLATLSSVNTVFKYPVVWWTAFCLSEVVVMPILSIQLYYHGHFTDSLTSVRSAYNIFRRVIWLELQHRHWRPLFTHRLTWILLVNILNIVASVTTAVASTVTISLSQYFLSSMIINFALYFFYYLFNKLMAKEPVGVAPILYLLAAVGFWIAALKMFFTETIDWNKAPAQSRELNQECSLFGFYDTHDLWHLFSSIAWFFSFMVLLTMDDEISTKRREIIDVF